MWKLSCLSGSGQHLFQPTLPRSLRGSGQRQSWTPGNTAEEQHRHHRHRGLHLPHTCHHGNRQRLPGSVLHRHTQILRRQAQRAPQPVRSGFLNQISIFTKSLCSFLLFSVCPGLGSTSQSRSPIRMECSPWFPPCRCTTFTSCCQSRSTGSSTSAPIWSPSKTFRGSPVSHTNSSHKHSRTSVQLKMSSSGGCSVIRSTFEPFTVSSAYIWGSLNYHDGVY